MIYPAENIAFVRTIKHAEEFYITQFSFSIPSTNVTIPIKLYGKISMTRYPGRIVVSVIYLDPCFIFLVIFSIKKGEYTVYHIQ